MKKVITGFSTSTFASVIFLFASLLFLEIDDNFSDLKFWFSAFCLSVSMFLLFFQKQNQNTIHLFPAIPMIATIYLITGVLGYIQNSNLNPTDYSYFRFKLPTDIAQKTLKIFFSSSIALCFGYITAKLTNHTRKISSAEVQREISSPATTISNTAKLRLVFLVFLSNITYAFLYGFQNLLQRNEYIPMNANINSNFLLSLVNVINLVSFLVLGWLNVQTKHITKLLTSITFTISLIIYFGEGSRTVSLGIILFVTGQFLGNRTYKRAVIILVALPFSIFLSNLVIFFRGTELHGFFGHLKAMRDFDFTKFGNFIHSNVFISSFAVTGFTSFLSHKITISETLITLNPLPGSFTGWYEIADSMRLNYYTPFSTVGELNNISPLFSFIFFFALGYFYSFLNINQSKRTNMLSLYKVYFATASLFLFTILSLQYNLRSCMRIIYLNLLVQIIFSATRKRIKSPNV